MVSFFFRGLPNHPTMKVNPVDEAFVQDFMVDLPENPIPNDREACLTSGAIGWTIHGVALYNPFTIEGHNAVEGDNAEMFDECQGHPSPVGTYHYHQLPDSCVFPDKDLSVHGIARDGFPIYGPYKEDGSEVQESELDKCHGRCGVDGRYRYHMTKTYPYIMGCFRGTPMEFTKIDRPPVGLPTVADGATRPPPPDEREGPNSPNKCAYNPVTENEEFQTCSAYVGGPPGSGSVRNQITSSLVFTACMIMWLLKLIC